MSRKKAPVEGIDVHEHAAPETPAPGPAEELAPASGIGGGEKRPPAYVVKVGALKVAVWINHTKDNKPYYAVTTARVYRNGDGEWAQSYSYGRSDLLPMAEALRQAWLWITENPLSYGDDDVPF